MDYLQVSDKIELQTLWQQGANASKYQEFSVFQELLISYLNPKAFSHLTPVSSVKLVQDLLTFTFFGDP
jgi:hypothetical protein